MKTSVVVMALSALVLTGCGQTTATNPPHAATPSSSTAIRPQVLKFGADAKGRRGVINVSSPAPYDLPPDPARPGNLTRGLKFAIRVDNTGRDALQATSFSVSATIDSSAAHVVVDDRNQIGDRLKTDILPGKSGGLTMVVAAPAKPSDITIKIQFAQTKPLYWNDVA